MTLIAIERNKSLRHLIVFLNHFLIFNITISFCTHWRSPTPRRLRSLPSHSPLVYRELTFKHGVLGSFWIKIKSVSLYVSYLIMYRFWDIHYYGVGWKNNIVLKCADQLETMNRQWQEQFDFFTGVRYGLMFKMTLPTFEKGNTVVLMSHMFRDF